MLNEDNVYAMALRGVYIYHINKMDGCWRKNKINDIYK